MTRRTLGKFALDVLLWTSATPLAFFTRFDWATPPEMYPRIWIATAAMFVLKAAAEFGAGLHRQAWRRIAFRDLSAVTRAIFAVLLLELALLFLEGGHLHVPRSVPLIDAFFGGVLLIGLRVLARFLQERRRGRAVPAEAHRRVLVVGAGEAGALIVREMLRHPETGLEPIGFVDDDPNKLRQRIASVPVLGRLADLEDLIAEHRADEVLIAIPSQGGNLVRDVVRRTAQVRPPVRHRIIPGVFEVLSGGVSVDRIRNVEVEDLLGRPPVKLDLSAIGSLIEGKTVLVTGAGGSIGSELVRQICRFHPGRLVFLGRGENSIYQLERELQRDWPEVGYRSYIGDVRDRRRVDTVFSAEAPQVAFHAAAHKHVPLMEANAGEAILNNVVGTKNVAEAALASGTKHFVNISTDKAVNPSSIMGASKRMAEYLVHHVADRTRDGQVFVSVRFGNVLGSRGSVIPLFQEQIRNGGPVTVTHPDMKRYFMTIPEASQLVLQAVGLGRNGETYILDMGEPVKILDVARDLIRLSGFEPDVDIHVAVSGPRPGEKLFEELMTAGEREAVTSHQRIFVARRPQMDPAGLERTVASLVDAAMRDDAAAIRLTLNEYVEGCTCDPALP